jgi:hypothetical protein
MAKQLLNSTNNNALKEHYNSIPYVQRLILRDNIISQCMIDKSTFYNLLNARSPIRDIYVVIINKVIGQELLTIETTTKKQ